MQIECCGSHLVEEVEQPLGEDPLDFGFFAHGASLLSSDPTSWRSRCFLSLGDGGLEVLVVYLGAVLFPLLLQSLVQGVPLFLRVVECVCW